MEPQPVVDNRITPIWRVFAQNGLPRRNPPNENGLQSLIEKMILVLAFYDYSLYTVYSIQYQIIKGKGSYE